MQPEPTIAAPSARLEELSDKARKGIPIAFSDAIAVADYQTALKKEREKKPPFWRQWGKR